ncbi:hypothetical protein RSOL_196120 [Rhizoctonia solani AG-3 Rhs1AP]|uniref:CxC2-like cysteine cluster KDZ transposase-associated domain-containing protein n=1 Tax=Rhizoctonia solani AG-3 Rhs1AP TaxID=1086054 RepID=X8J357_9AGAM|nr:hypothetical protein RSOL_196120 [Rhizoctonia solani AG-3 Rhs1AP]
MAHAQPARLRELLRVSRQYFTLQLLKRAGQTVTTPKELECLALRCPACPRLGVNYIPSDVETGLEWLFSQLLSYDGSFQLVHKNKAYDEQDVCLTDRLLYFVSQVHYTAHLIANKDTAYETTVKADRCNNHRAASDTWVRQSGVAETGLGAVTCARHTIFMPQGTVNYVKGERFGTTDFGVGGVMQLLMTEGADRIGVFYDIFCRWGTYFWDRAPSILLPGGPLERPQYFFGAVPKYHLAAHIDSCYARFSLNNMEGVGRLDAEGCERAWANLNQAAGSTSEKGPGARIDSINHCMNDWNWRKITSMVTSILSHFPEAVKLSTELEELWLTVHQSISPSLTRTWEAMSTEPQLVNGSWTSVFLLSKNGGSSRLKKVLDLNMIDSERIIQLDSAEPAVTAPTWLSEGLDIEKLQVRLSDDIKQFGKNLTDSQSLEVTKRRLGLHSRISSHRTHASLFIDVQVASAETPKSLAEETDGRPELAKLYIPSHLKASISRSERSLRLIKMEVELRKAECYETLRRVRTGSMQYSEMVKGKNDNARGEIAKTRARTMIERVAARVKHAREDYNRSYQALTELGIEKKDLLPLQTLKSSDFKDLHAILSGARDIPQGRLRLPWFWQVRERIPGQPEISDQEEYAEAIRVEWFRGRERFKRWKEEVFWLQRELASTLFDFHSRSQTWESLSSSAYATRNPGYLSYCLRQRDVYHQLLVDGFIRGEHILNSKPLLPICERAITEFSKLSMESGSS